MIHEHEEGWIHPYGVLSETEKTMVSLKNTVCTFSGTCAAENGTEGSVPKLRWKLPEEHVGNFSLITRLTLGVYLVHPRGLGSWSCRLCLLWSNPWERFGG